MGSDRSRKKNVNIMVDMVKANHTAFRSYIICAILYGIIGVCLLVGDCKSTHIWEPVFYYLLLFLPVVSAAYDYRKNAADADYRYNLFITAMIFYIYLLYLDRDFLYFIFAVWLIGTSIIYFDMQFSKKLGWGLTLVQIASAIYFSYKDNAFTEIRWLQVFSIIVLAIFINFAAQRMIAFQQNKMEELEVQQKRFEALLSVDKKRIFEYDLKKDELILIKTDETGIRNQRRIERFSETAKQFRYVLYADWDIFDEFIQKCRAGQGIINTQLRLRNKNADYLWYQINAKALPDEEGKSGNVVGTMENVDEVKRYELHLQDENMRDPLTKLYKRAYAKQLMSDFLKGQDGSEYAGLLIIDIDNFTVLCEEMGNTFGDEVIRSMASDLEEIFYTSDILGRVGGDEFVILMKYIRDPEHIDKKIHEIQDVVHKTYSQKEMNFTSTVTIGASVYPVDGDDFGQLYDKAEKALAYAKAEGKNCHCFYEADKEAEYARFELEDKHNKIKWKEEQEMLRERDDSESLTDLAFKLIDTSKDTDSAINLLLRQVARQLDIDGICIRRKMEKENKLVYPYRCVIGNNLPEFGDEVELSKIQWERERVMAEKNNGLVCCSDVQDLEDALREGICHKYHVKSFARSAFFERGEYIGGIDFLDCRKKREWTKEERNIMQTLSNVISSYLLKMKAFEEASDTVEKLTGYDTITDFYKYEKFMDYAEEYLKEVKTGKYTVIYVDFSNFKFINETYGYEVGDKILLAYADEMRSHEESFIAGSRVFSDNLVCLFKNIWDSEQQMIDELLAVGDRFAQKVKKEYLESNISLSVGVCPFEIGDKAISFKSIVSNANLARKEAKKPENRNCIIYSEDMGEKLIREVSYANDMESAFDNQEFVVYFQPKIDLKNHLITGAEALIRWVKPDGSMIYPNDFIPVFEKNKTITRVDYFVYEEVCKYLAQRIQNKERHVAISMNVSRIHLNSIDRLVEYIRNLLDKYQIPPRLLEFELTETVFTDVLDSTVELMSRLRELGVKVSMDDFGSGYSSLNVLTKLPLDVLKLDKEFLKDFETDSDGKIIIPSIIDMAKKLQLSVVCEGVETKEQVEFLRQVDCDLVQGYYYSRPVPKNVFSQMLADDDFVVNHEEAET